MKFQLPFAHYFPGDKLLEEGTLIGDGTPYPIPDGWVPPGGTIPLDDEAKALYDKTGRDKENWGKPPEENIPIRPGHPVARSPQAHVQPVIPPPLEHLTHPSDMKPGEVAKPLGHLVAEIANKNQVRLSSDGRLPGQGPKPAPAEPPKAAVKSEPPKPPAPPSKQVPRDTDGLTVKNDTGEFKDKS